MRKERGKALATVTLLLVAATACDASRNDPSASPSPAQSPRTTPARPSTPVSRTTAPASDSRVASESASELVRHYYAVRDELREHPTQPLSKLKTVATSVELKAQTALFKRERDLALHQTGHTKISRLQVQTVNLDNSDPAVGKVPTVQVDVCWNVSDVDIVDRNGKSVISPTRPNVGWIRYTVANYHWAADPIRGWRVATSQDLKQKPCAAY